MYCNRRIYLKAGSEIWDVLSLLCHLIHMTAVRMMADGAELWFNASPPQKCVDMGLWNLDRNFGEDVIYLCVSGVFCECHFRYLQIT